MKKIELFHPQQDVEEFCVWLNSKGYNAVLKGGGETSPKNYVDGKCNRETRRLIEDLYRQFEAAS